MVRLLVDVKMEADQFKAQIAVQQFRVQINAVINNSNATTPINVFQRIGFVMEVTTVAMEVTKIPKRVLQKLAKKVAALSSLCAPLQLHNTHMVDAFQNHGDVISTMIVLMEAMKQIVPITDVVEAIKVIQNSSDVTVVNAFQ